MGKYVGFKMVKKNGKIEHPWEYATIDLTEMWHTLAFFLCEVSLVGGCVKLFAQTMSFLTNKVPTKQVLTIVLRGYLLQPARKKMKRKVLTFILPVMLFFQILWNMPTHVANMPEKYGVMNVPPFPN